MNDEGIIFSQVIDWKDRSTWFESINEWVRRSGIISMDSLRSADVSSYFDDDDRWMKLIRRHSSQGTQPLKRAITHAIAQSKIRFYHATRCSDVSVYENSGILAHNESKLKDKALCLARDLGVDIGEMPQFASANNIDEGKCYIALDDRCIVRRCGHYLIYGSEFICSWFGEVHRDALKDVGEPVFVHVDMPMAGYNKQTREIASIMIREWARGAALPQSEVSEIDFAVTHRGAILPHYISGFSYPSIIPDPLNYGSVYISPGQPRIGLR